jgi:hypothetical protein
VKIIIEEGGVPPLLRLLKEGTVSGQEAAAQALGRLARDQERIKAMRQEGSSAVFVHILGNHVASMKVQVGVYYNLLCLCPLCVCEKLCGLQFYSLCICDRESSDSFVTFPFWPSAE